LIRNDFNAAFEKVDLIASPVSPTPAFKLGEKNSDPLSMYLADIYTISANLAGICGISVPCGTVEEEGSHLPIGLQLIGKPMAEADLLKAAHAVEVG
jgi:aspartyl-tRNA(Asn)/glutamyl-tRNA(Gln) amidotransferase subunit A